MNDSDRINILEEKMRIITDSIDSMNTSLKIADTYVFLGELTGLQSGSISIPITFSAPDGVDEFRVFINGELYTTYTSLNGISEITVDTTEFPNGNLNVQVILQPTVIIPVVSDSIVFSIYNADVEAPTITLTPFTGAQSGTITLTSNVSDNVAVTAVDYDIYDPNNLNEFTVTTSAPFTYDLDTTSLPDGNYTLQATAVDGAGNSATSNFVNLTIEQPDTETPVISILTDLTGNLSGSVDIEVTASDNVGVTLVHLVVADAANPGGGIRSSSNISPFTTILDTTELADGDYTLWVVAYDGTGNLGESTHIPITILNTVAAIPPNSSILSITPSETPYSGDLTLVFKGTDNGGGEIVRFDFEVDGQVVASTTTFEQINTVRRDFTLVFDTTTLSDGSHSMLGIAVDINGNTKNSFSLSMPVDNAAPLDTEAPTITLTNTETEYTGSTVFSFTATDNIGVTQVELFIDDVLSGTVISAPFDFAYDTNVLANGAHVVRGVAYDAAGNTTNSISLTINVTNTTPGPTPTPTPTPTAGTVNESLDAMVAEADSLSLLLSADIRDEALMFVGAVSTLKAHSERLRNVIDASGVVGNIEDAKLVLNEIANEFSLTKTYTSDITSNELKILKKYTLSISRDILTIMADTETPVISPTPDQTHPLNRENDPLLILPLQEVNPITPNGVTTV